MKTKDYLKKLKKELAELEKSGGGGPIYRHNLVSLKLKIKKLEGQA